MTNGDKIRQMTDEELTEWLAERGDCKTCAWYGKDCAKRGSCKRGIAEWLRKEANEDDERR